MERGPIAKIFVFTLLCSLALLLTLFWAYITSIVLALLMASGFLVYNLCYSAIMEYGGKPKFIGNETRMNSLLVFIGILGGMKIFGIMGIIYGPLIMTIFLTLSEIYRLEYRDKLT